MISVGVGGEMPLIRRWGLTAIAQLYGSAALGVLPGSDRQVPAEALTALRWYTSNGVVITTGGGVGCSCGMGAPSFRFFAGAIWIPGRSQELEALERFREPSQDPDRDGVIGGQDRCPEIPGPVENRGCPDEDGDGVLGSADACPDKPGAVENRGCPEPDSDGDGTPDRTDRCPTFPVEVAGKDGCPLARIAQGKIVILEQVHFATDQDVILPESFPTLQEVGRLVKQNKHIHRVRIEGHTDIRASEAYNLDLSKRRAASVMKYLLAQGIDPARLRSEGFGRSRPVASNDSEGGMALNRRVEFIIEDAAQ
jgi:OmpA-OmpF porin, OOP family